MNASSRVGGAREADGYRQVIVGFRRSPQGPDAETTARLPHNQGEMEMTAATFILTLVGTCVAIRALWVWRNTLENQRVDECLAAVYDVVGLANRCLSLKEKGVRYDRIWQAYWEAWNSQRKFSSAWAIVLRYHEEIEPEKMPERVHDLLLEVEGILESPVTEGFDEIRQKLESLKQDVKQRLPRPAGWLPKWNGWADVYRRLTAGWLRPTI